MEWSRKNGCKLGGGTFTCMHASLSWSLRSVAWTWFANSRLAFVEESNGLARGKVAAPGKNGTKAERERERGLGTAWLTGLGPLNICLEACTLWGFDCFGTRVEDRFNDRRPIPLRKSRARICSERRADSAAPYRVASLSGPRIFLHDYSDFLGIFLNPVETGWIISSGFEFG